MGLLAVLTLTFAGIVGRLVDLQVVGDERFVAYGESQRIRAETLPASRGSLLDRNGAELALSVPASTIVADPRMVEDPAEAAARLAPILDADVAVLEERLGADSAFEYLARQVDDDVAAAVRAERLTGIFIQPEPTRTHPAGQTAMAVLGRADLDGIGVSGLEQQFDEVLTGTPGEVLYERSLAAGVQIPVGEHQLQPARPGDDVVLTLDRNLQYVVEQTLAARIEETDARGGMVIVMVPGTGEILAMASLSVDEATGEVVPAGYNRTVVDSFAPGSVLKVVTIGASLEEGLSTPDRPIEVPYALTVGGHEFQDASQHGTETWPLRRILVESSNVGAIRVGGELGNERIGDYLDRFGFGRPTGLSFPGEAAGLVRPWEEWHGSDYAGVVIGTGVSTTAMQVLAAYNVIANDGVYVAPRLVEARIDPEGVRHPEPQQGSHRVVSERTSNELADMLTGVVEDGTGSQAAVPGYEVAGKTGTAWKQQEDGSFENAAGGHDYMATFVGFAPVDDPRVSVIVVIDQPGNVYSGGSAAAPAFSQIAEHALRVLDVPPVTTDEDGVLTVDTLPDGDEQPAGRVRAEPAGRGDEDEVAARG
ncbi:peptidoglycan D,D-transpeptidase FtsI family protein [Actinomarinicola tropica]|uniref:peptidoglycan D,D-transpeptidase FtsI family protein n=1 Tax=Actinomarinicola tropica TaxID=2789776 RepID=UPI001E2B76CD|nr:penicillin-binding protein 2 [Actinomarinicola tropica]